MIQPLIHHIEICVNNAEQATDLFTTGYKFQIIAKRLTSSCQQTVLQSNLSRIIINKRVFPISISDHDELNKELSDANTTNRILKDNLKISLNGIHTQNNLLNRISHKDEDWTVFCCENQNEHSIDSVFNVALCIENVDKVTDIIRSYGNIIIKEPSNISDKYGTVRYSIIKSCCGNVVHTLIDKSKYHGKFLPLYEDITNTTNPRNVNSNNKETVDNSLTMHFDHVTYVCNPGSSNEIIQWYEGAFGMKRFFTNSTESEEEGFVLKEDIGLKLKALEYWQCAETGLSCPGSFGEHHLKLVLAEPIPEIKSSHVASFLEAHHGPGIQHIGLHCDNIVNTVASLSNYVTFRKPPLSYYTQFGKNEELLCLGYVIEHFHNLGILLDIEPDSFDKSSVNTLPSKRHLMQIFSEPLFSKNTFFMEIIQRCGAIGFGAGNISALAQSIQYEMNNSKKQVVSSVI